MFRRLLAICLASLVLGGHALAEEDPVADGLTISAWTTTCTEGGTCPGSWQFSPTRWHDEPKMRMVCEISHYSYNDPIVFPGQPGIAHGHMFWGNTLTNAASTYNTLRTTGSGSCQGGPLNRTAYWSPWLYNTVTNLIQVPYFVELYYSNGVRRSLKSITSADPAACPGGNLQDDRPAACPTNAIARMPRGLKFITGFSLALPGFPATYNGNNNINWQCYNSSGTLTAQKDFIYDPVTPSNGFQNADCPAGGAIWVRMDTPNCWNGNLTHADHYSHMAWPGLDSNGENLCPATHPTRITQFTVIIGWDNPNGISDFQNWKLSSDTFNGATYRGGETFHTDWFGAWNDTIQAHFHKHVNGMINDAAGGEPPYVDADEACAKTETDCPVGGSDVRQTGDGGLGIEGGVGLILKGGNLGNGFTVSTVNNNPAPIAIPSVILAGRGARARGRIR